MAVGALLQAFLAEQTIEKAKDVSVYIHPWGKNKTKQKSAILMRDIGNGEGYAWVAQR